MLPDRATRLDIARENWLYFFHRGHERIAYIAWRYYLDLLHQGAPAGSFDVDGIAPPERTEAKLMRESPHHWVQLSLWHGVVEGEPKLVS